jgi:hypothetical protein
MAEEGGAKLDDYDFSGTTSGASDTFPSEAGQIKKGGYVDLHTIPPDHTMAALQQARGFGGEG